MRINLLDLLVGATGAALIGYFVPMPLTILVLLIWIVLGPKPFKPLEK